MSQTGQFNASPPPPPPPPPPANFEFSYQKPRLNPQALNANELHKINENELNLAIKRLLSIDKQCSNIFFMSNTCLFPQLQDGPKCGLVALSIASSASKNFVNVEDIFQTAVSLGLTRQGEMFSSESLALLAEKCCGFKTRIIKGGLTDHFYCIVTSLLSKCLVLVPYDADFNHSPCCKKGTKAHWAVITGLLITEQRHARENSDENFLILNSWKAASFCNCIDKADNIDNPLSVSIHQENIIIGKKSPKEIAGNFNQGKIYLIGLQGKSHHVGVWLFPEMAASNANLVSFSATRDYNHYVFPEGGLEEGLKGKAIILDYS